MNPYYQTLLKDIVDLFGKGEYEQVDSIIKNELSLPYVPSEAQEILESYQQECRPYLSKTPASSRADVEEWVTGTLRQKEMAASALQAMNLRQYHREVQTLLEDKELLDEFKGELIEALMEQKIDEPYTIEKMGTQIEFVPSLIPSAAQDPVVQQTQQVLEDWLGAENPGLLDFTRQLLQQEILEMRPFDFSDMDPKVLAASLVRLVFHAMHDQEGWKEFSNRHSIEDQSYPLLIEKRGE